MGLALSKDKLNVFGEAVNDNVRNGHCWIFLQEFWFSLKFLDFKEDQSMVLR